MEMTLERWETISHAVFDRYIQKTFLDKDSAICDGEINKQELIDLAKKVGCDTDSLHKAIYASCGRISGITIAKQMSNKDEIQVIVKVLKDHVRNLTVPLKKYRREFCKVTHELNYKNPKLDLKIKELLLFTKPLYLEILDEIFIS